MGGNTCAASPTRARRGAQYRLTESPVIGTRPRGPSTRMAPRKRLGLTLDGERESCVSSFTAVLPRQARHPDEAGAPAGQRDQGEGPVPGMKFGRGFAVVPVMGNDEVKADCG